MARTRTALIGTPEATAEGGQTRLLLRLTEVAQTMGLGRSTVYRWARNGRLPVVHRQGGMYVPRAALDAFLAAEAEAALENLRSTDGDRASDDAQDCNGVGGQA